MISSQLFEPHFQYSELSCLSLVWHLELLIVFSSTFKTIILPLFWRSEPPSLLSYGVQSHHLFAVWRLEPPSLLSYDGQSRPSQSGVRSCIFSLAFRAIVCFQFNIQSHYVFFSFGVQSRVFSLAFKVVSSLWHLESLSSLAFDATIFLQFWCSEPLCILIQAFRVTIFPRHSESQLLTFIFTGISYLAFTILHQSSFSSPHYFVFIASSPCSSRLPFLLHMTQSFELTTHISVILLSTLRLAFSCSTHIVVIFGRILSCTQGGQTVTHL